MASKNKDGKSDLFTIIKGKTGKLQKARMIEQDLKTGNRGKMFLPLSFTSLIRHSRDRLFHLSERN